MLGDGTFIGHNTVLATLDHDIDPNRRHILYPAPIHIGRKVWIGVGVIITKGVTIGDNSIVAAGAVVTPDIPSNVIATVCRQGFSERSDRGIREWYWILETSACCHREQEPDYHDCTVLLTYPACRYKM